MESQANKKREDVFMDWLTDEILFYGGIAIAAISLIAAIFYFSLSQIRRIRLNARLDAEYGEKNR